VTSLASLAAHEYERRRAIARHKVAQDQLDPSEADALLRPWLALACRARADREEYDDALAELRAIPAEPDSAQPSERSRATGSVRAFFDDGQVRAVVADEICGLPTIRTTLAAARDKAIDRAADAKGLDVERNGRAAALVALALAFGAPPYRPKPAVPAQHQEAA
jgi:hypothetical protein